MYVNVCGFPDPLLIIDAAVLSLSFSLSLFLWRIDDSYTLESGVCRRIRWNRLKKNEIGKKSKPRLQNQRKSRPINVRIHLTRHDHHPHQKHTSDNPKRKFRLPALTNIPLLQKRKRVQIRAVLVIAKDIGVALVVDVGACE